MIKQMTKQGFKAKAKKKKSEGITLVIDYYRV